MEKHFDSFTGGQAGRHTVVVIRDGDLGGGQDRGDRNSRGFLRALHCQYQDSKMRIATCGKTSKELQEEGEEVERWRGVVEGKEGRCQQR